MNRQTMPFKKSIILFVLTALVVGQVVYLPAVLEVQNAQALPHTEGDKPEWDCGANGIGPGLFGSCVPIQVAADPNRGTRNVLKNILTAVLYGAGIAMGQWLAKAINDKLQIRDYYGYDRSLRDMVYRQRILFDKYLDPTERKIVDMGYDQVFRGGVQWNRVATDLSQIQRSRQYYPTPPVFSNQPLGASPNLTYFQDPNIYSNMFMWGISPTQGQIYFEMQDKSLALRAQSEQASALEIANAQGYKSTRSDADLVKMWATKDQSFYGQVFNPNLGQIRTPGAYAARVVQVAVQRLLNRDYINTNVTYAAIAEGSAWAFFRLFNQGGLFGSSNAAVGSTPKGETFYKDPTAKTAQEDTSNGVYCNACLGANNMYTCLDPVPDGMAANQCTPTYPMPNCDACSDNGVFTCYSGTQPHYSGACVPLPDGSGGGSFNNGGSNNDGNMIEIPD